MFFVVGQERKGGKKGRILLKQAFEGDGYVLIEFFGGMFGCVISVFKADGKGSQKMGEMLGKKFKDLTCRLFSRIEGALKRFDTLTKGFETEVAIRIQADVESARFAVVRAGRLDGLFAECRMAHPQGDGANEIVGCLPMKRTVSTRARDFFFFFALLQTDRRIVDGFLLVKIDQTARKDTVLGWSDSALCSDRLVVVGAQDIFCSEGLGFGRCVVWGLSSKEDKGPKPQRKSRERTDPKPRCLGGLGRRSQYLQSIAPILRKKIAISRKHQAQRDLCRAFQRWALPHKTNASFGVCFECHHGNTEIFACARWCVFGSVCKRHGRLGRFFRKASKKKLKCII